jgi:hypothetical protein
MMQKCEILLSRDSHMICKMQMVESCSDIKHYYFHFACFAMTLPQSSFFLRACKFGDVKTIHAVLKTVTVKDPDIPCLDDHDDGCCSDVECVLKYIKEGMTAAIHANNILSIRCILSFLPQDTHHRLHTFLDWCVLQAISLRRTVSLGYLFVRISAAHCSCFNDTAFMYEACNSGDMNIALLTISHCRDAWLFGFKGACDGGHLSIIAVIMDEGNDELDFTDALMYAASVEFPAAVEIIANTGKVTDWGRGLLGACSNNDRELIDFFITRGAKNWDECLFVACRNCKLDAAQLMIEKGATDFNGAMLDVIANGRKRVGTARDGFYPTILLLINSGATNLNLLTVRDITILLSMGLAGDHFSGSADQHQVIQALEKYRKREQSHLCKCLRVKLPISLLRSLVGPYICYSTL